MDCKQKREREKEIINKLEASKKYLSGFRHVVKQNIMCLSYITYWRNYVKMWCLQWLALIKRRARYRTTKPYKAELK